MCDLMTVISPSIVEEDVDESLRTAMISPHFEEGRSASTLCNIFKIHVSHRLSHLGFPLETRGGLLVCRDIFYIPYPDMAGMSLPELL